MARAAPGPRESSKVRGNTAPSGVRTVSPRLPGEPLMAENLRAADGPTVMHITTVDMTLQLLLGALRYLQAHGFKVSGVCAPGPGVAAVERAGIQVRTVPFTRRITPLQDLAALTKLTRLLLHQRPRIVHTHTPKANLLGQWAARLARIPVRVATVHGLYFTAATPSPQRWMYEWMERCSAWPAQTVWLINREDVATAKTRRLYASATMRLLPGGLGVDLERFDPARYDPDLRRRVREELGWGAEHFVVGFVGRLVREKGLAELFAAAASLKERIPALRLLVVGPADPEKVDAISEQLLAIHGIQDICVLTGRRADTERLYLGMDVFALPSHREGLPVAAMEAQAMGLPLITTDARGCKEVVLPGRTGLMVPARDARALAAAIAQLHGDARLRREMSQAARQYARLRFDQVQAFASFEHEYLRLLQKLHQKNTVKGIVTAAQAAPPNRPMAKRVYSRYGKRWFDLMVAASAWLLLAPLMLLVMLLMQLQMGQPVVFRQRRPGLHGRVFELLKLRTMTNVRNAQGSLLPDAQRLTPLGRLLRQTSLDELPELLNVIRGDMSLVGPRPLLMAYLARYSAEQMRRHEVKPGITGWAQVHGRNATTWEERFDLDAWYVDHLSFRLDLKIMAMTLARVLTQEGINQPGAATMREFMGNPGDRG